MNEKKLVKDILNGDKKAFNKFYKTFKPKLKKYIFRKIGNKKDAEEVLHDTFLSALDSLPLFKYNSSVLTWLRAIARHEIADYYRKKKIKTIVFSRFPFLEKLVSRALGPELALQEKEAKQKIFITLKNISEGYAQILRLKYIEGKSYAEIAKGLDITIKAVESRLSRARLAFRKEYAKKYPVSSIKYQETNKEDWSLFYSSEY